MKKVIFISLVGLLILVSGGVSYGYDWLESASDMSDTTDQSVTYYSSTPTNIPPIAVDDTATTTCGTPVRIDVLANDIDEDNKVDLYVYSFTQPLHGTVTQMANMLTYTPEADFGGTDNFTYKVSDFSGGWDKGTVTITVTCQPPQQNNPPVAVDDSATACCGTPVNINVLANDYDIDGDTVSLYGIIQNPSNGTATISGSLVAYTPDPGFNGTDSLKYKITDGNGGYATAWVTITVTCTQPPSNCQQCGPGYGGEGKTYYIEVTYGSMTADATAKWDSKKGRWDKLSSNTILVFGDGSWVKVHTSCSQPLYIGMTVPVYTGTTKKPGNPVGYATVTDLIISPCVPEPPSGGGHCGSCR